MGDEAVARGIILSVLMGKEEQPKNLIEEISKSTKTIAVEADKIAESLGNVKAQNAKYSSFRSTC